MIGALVVGTVLALVAMGIVLYPLFFPVPEPPAAARAPACGRCGGALLPGARYCAWCGAAVEPDRSA